MSYPVAMRIDRAMKTLGIDSDAESLFLQNINKNDVEVQPFPVSGMQDWSTLSSSVFSGQTKTWSLMRQVASFSQTFPKTFFRKTSLSLFNRGPEAIKFQTE